MKKYVVIEKEVGQTPLQALERYQQEHPELAYPSAEDFREQMRPLQEPRRASRMHVYGDEPSGPKRMQMHRKYPPMAYAGRLDPMASGKLLILIGDECKVQERYHGLDKEYEFSILFGVSSDTGDVLGRLTAAHPPRVPEISLYEIVHDLVGEVTFPYPHFSSRTVQGKPLHVWTLERRLDEIEIPKYTATIYSLSLVDFSAKYGNAVADEALQKIETIPPVTEDSKALGQDFRRADVRNDWQSFREKFGEMQYPIATFRCICSSGLYMRTLAEEIAKKLSTKGLAWSIHRSKIGTYQTIFKWGFWRRLY